MIRTNLQTVPKRRLAVIAIPRPQQTRLGVIRDGNPAGYGPPVAWTTISNEGPESTGNFLSSVMAKQQYATLNTPGTLSYTPAAGMSPAENVPPWNSWLQPNCPPGSPAAAASSATPAAAAAAALGSPPDFFWVAVGLMTSAAAAVYLYQAAQKGR
jgi:hypothetical protein